MSYKLDKEQMSDPCASPRWLSTILAWQRGFGCIIYFWLLVVSFLGAIVLLFAGIAYWSSWVFLAGLLSLRLFVYLLQIGNDFWDLLDPPKDKGTK